MKEHRGIFTLPELDRYLGREVSISFEKLNRGIWTATDGRYRTIFLEGNDSVTAFDTFGTPGKARAYGRAIRQATVGKPIDRIIYSHDHLDHAGFAADLAPAAEIIADETAAAVIDLREAEGQLSPNRRLQGTENSFEVDGFSFLLLNPGPTHGSGNMAAYFPRQRLLFMSDTILPNARYGVLPDYHWANFLRFMRGLLELDFETFVPGRYAVMTRPQFERGCDYLEALDEASQQAFVEMVPVWVLEAITSYVQGKLRDRFGDLEGFEEQSGLTAFRIVHHYLMGGWGLEDTPEAGVLLFAGSRR